MKKSKNKPCSYLPINPLNPRKKATIRAYRDKKAKEAEYRQTIEMYSSFRSYIGRY